MDMREGDGDLAGDAMANDRFAWHGIDPSFASLAQLAHPCLDEGPLVFTLFSMKG
jgi:hypothetical protein